MVDDDRTVLLEFIWARLARAQEHIDEFKRDLATLSETDRTRVTTNINADRTQVAVNVVYRRPHPNRRWGAIIGDVAHCVRSALDNTVYAIALTRHGYPPPDERRLAFPIANTDDDWRKVRGIIRSLSVDCRAIICGAQPCHGGDRHLSLLGSLNDMDKHRMTAPTAGAMGTAKFRFHKPPVGPILNWRALSGPAITGAPYLVITFAEPQPTEVDVEIELALSVFILHKGGWHPAVESLEKMKREAERIIELLDPYIL